MPRYSWLMFDADNTLLDFDGASERALFDAFQHYGLTCTPEIQSQYKAINGRVWAAFERNEISALALRSRRFDDLFEAIGQPAPVDGKTFGALYLDLLVHASEAYHGVHDLLDTLGRHFTISLITNGLREVQRPRLDKLGLTPYFHSIIVSDEIGVSKPHADFFNHAYEALPLNVPKHEVLVVGDNIHTDIGGAQAFGFSTCWIHAGRSNSSAIQPDLSLEHVGQLREQLLG